MKQRTIKKSVEIVGIGLHKGVPVNMKLEPLEDDMGIVFYRKDEAVSNSNWERGCSYIYN